MQKSDKEIGSYRLELYEEETRAAYTYLPCQEGEDVVLKMYRHHLSTAAKSALQFLESFGIDPEKITCARPLSEPDEEGEILFYCAARFCGRLLAGGDTVPRKSEEEAGLSLIFVGENGPFQTEPLPVETAQAEMRFVIPFRFDPTFFDQFQA